MRFLLLSRLASVRVAGCAVDAAGRFAAWGSRVYEGHKRIGDKTRSITVTDHRPRLCRDVVPAKILHRDRVPTDATARAELENLGWMRVEN